MISVPLLVISGRVFFGAVASSPRSFPFGASGSEMRKTTSWIVPSRGWIVKPIWSPFLGFVQVRCAFGGSFLAAVVVDVEKDAVLRHVGVEPCPLGSDERLAVDGEAVVFVAFSEEVLLPDNAEGCALVLAEFRILGVEAGLVERLGDLPPDRALPLLRLVLLPDVLLILTRGRGDRAQFLLLRHVAGADLVEDRRMDACEQPELSDLARGNGERGGDGLFGPAFGGKAFYRAPKVDRGHGGAHHVLADGAHMVFVVGVLDQDTDLGEAEFDRGSDPPFSEDEGQCAGLFARHRRLENADLVDARGERSVGHFSGLDFTGIPGIDFEGDGIDASQFHLNSPGFRSSRTVSKTKP